MKFCLNIGLDIEGKLVSKVHLLLYDVGLDIEDKLIFSVHGFFFAINSYFLELIESLIKLNLSLYIFANN